MSYWKAFKFRLGRMLFRKRAELDLEEEMAFHLEMEELKNVQAGMPSDSARLAAKRGFGSTLRHKESSRRWWGVIWLEDALDDLKFGLRQMRRSPLFSVIAIITLAVGVGGTVALWSVVSSLVLQPLPYGQPNEIVRFWSDFDWRPVEFDLARDLRAESSEAPISPVSAFTDEVAVLHLGDRSLPVETVLASAELFDVLDVAAARGRTFRMGDDRPGAEPVVILSHTFWSTAFGADENILGRSLALDSGQATVIGIMPENFYFPSPDVAVWRPFVFDPASPGYGQNGSFALIGRQSPAASAGEIEGYLTGLTGALGARFTYPEAWDLTRDAFVEPLDDFLRGGSRRPLLLLLGAASVLLATATLNVAAMLTSRINQRQQEVGLRASLGASRLRLVRQMVAEVSLLGGLAGVFGAAMAWLAFGALVAALPLSNGFSEQLSLDWSLLLRALMVSLVVALVTSTAPVRQVLRGQVDGALRSASRGWTSKGSSRLQQTLVAVEVGLGVILAVGAALLIRSVDQLYRVDTGITANRAVAVDLLLPQDFGDDQRRQFAHALEARVGQLSTVTSVGIVNRLPLRDRGFQGPVTIPDRPDLAGPAKPSAYFRVVSAGFLDAVGLSLLEGRQLQTSDRESSVQVALVSASLARELWPQETAVGKRFGADFEGAENPLTIVGVVEDVRLEGVAAAPPRVVYRPRSQFGFPSRTQVLVARSDLDLDLLVRELRSAVAGISPRTAVGRTQSLQSVVEASIQEPLRLRFFLVLFGLGALLVGAVGVYGVVSFTVATRRAEYGVRAILGASPSELRWAVMQIGMVPVLVGAAIGSAACLLGAARLGDFLYGVTSVDPVSYASVLLLFTAVGALASLAHARRIGRTDPVESLRLDS